MSRNSFKNLKERFNYARSRNLFSNFDLVRSHSCVAIAYIGKDGTIYNKTQYMSIGDMLIYIDGYMDGFNDAINNI